ncbi:MAG: hypothetical protein ACTSUP_00400 [Candidatus Heimdallarchaeaceae archaeon]
MSELTNEQKEHYRKEAEDHVEFLVEKVFRPAFVMAYIHGAKHGRADMCDGVKDVKDVSVNRIEKRYFRKTVEHPEGAVVHHGDCLIYSEKNVCTCGLHHDLLPLSKELINEVYPEYWSEGPVVLEEKCPAKE